MNFNEFLQHHQAIYKTTIQYKVRYGEETRIEQGILSKLSWMLG